MGSEDFAFMCCTSKPGCYVFPGNGDGGSSGTLAWPAPLLIHRPKLRLQRDLLPIKRHVLIELAQAALPLA
jgi:hippurate hydrolase